MRGMGRALSGANRADPFAFPVIGGSNPGFSNLTGKTEVTSGFLTGGQKTLGFVVTGQSNSTSNCTSTYTMLNPTKVLNVNPFDGKIYQWTEKALGPTDNSGTGFGGWIGRMFDLMIANSPNFVDKIICCNVGYDGTSINQWTNDSMYSGRLRTAIMLFRKFGIPINAFLQHQGEANQQLGTSQASYFADGRRMIASSRALGATAPWFIPQVTYVSGVTSSAVRAAQLQLCDNIDARFWFDSDAITTDRADGVHFSTGSLAAAAGAAALINSGVL